MLYERVLPFYDALGVSIGAVLTDNGREFCGKPDSHPYELLLALEGLEHRTTRIRSPQTNGFVERMNRTLLDECFRVEGRKTWYVTPEEIQRDLDRFLSYYNLERQPPGLPAARPDAGPSATRSARRRGPTAGRPRERGDSPARSRVTPTPPGEAGCRGITEPVQPEKPGVEQLLGTYNTASRIIQSTACKVHFRC
jgi:hypothetical protein